MDILHKLRQSATNALMSSICTVDDCTALKRYYVQLVRLTDKFPKLWQQKRDEVQESCDDVKVVGTSAPPLIFAW